MKIISILIIFSLNFCFGLTKYSLKCDEELLNVSYDSMMLQVGIIEKTNRNDGEVQKYLKAIGLKGDYPYCAAGQYWCFFVSAKSLNKETKAIPIRRTGLANEMFNDAKRKGKKSYFAPKKHDLIVWRKINSFRGHIERIISIQKKGWITTVGFNSSAVINNKKREGVFVKKRNIYHILGLLRTRGLIGFEK